MLPVSPWTVHLESPPETVALSMAVHGRHVTQESFYLKDYWALHFYEYTGALRVGEEMVNLTPGVVTLVPPAVEVTFHYQGVSTHLYTHFKLHNTTKDQLNLPLSLAPDHRLPLLKNILLQSIPLRHVSPPRVNLRLWDVLLGLETIANEKQDPSDSAIIENAVSICELEMNQPLTVAKLARRCGIPHNRLTQLFKQRFGCTPVSWLRNRRMERAAELLRHSDLPIKTIAYEVGIPDLQHFNKIAHRELGDSPRRYREAMKQG